MFVITLELYSRIYFNISTCVKGIFRELCLFLLDIFVQNTQTTCLILVSEHNNLGYSSIFLFWELTQMIGKGEIRRIPRDLLFYFVNIIILLIMAVAKLLGRLSSTKTKITKINLFSVQLKYIEQNGRNS